MTRPFWPLKVYILCTCIVTVMIADTFSSHVWSVFDVRFNSYAVCIQYSCTLISKSKIDPHCMHLIYGMLNFVLIDAYTYNIILCKVLVYSCIILIYTMESIHTLGGAAWSDAIRL